VLEIQSPAKGLVAHGVSTCAGCGLELVVRVALDVLGPNTIVVIPPGCAALFSGFGAETVLKVPGIQVNLGASAAYAAGIRAGLEVQGKHAVNVLALAGDGATVDIGLQSLSGALERGDRIIYVCYDNEGYMNTGVQSSGSTPHGAWTTTTPGGKPTARKDMLGIVAAHRLPYAATASVGYINDLRQKIARARDACGPSYIHVHTPCPAGWRFAPALTVEVARLAVRTRAWVLCEIVNGRLKINVPVKNPLPLRRYLAVQGRFAGVPEEEIVILEKEIALGYQELLSRGASPPAVSGATEKPVV